MSNVHSSPMLSPLHPSNANPPDLAALAVSLQETAQALLALSQASVSAASNAPAAKPTPRGADGETRSYYFPQASVNMERELLRQHHAQDFQGLLEEVHTLLVGLAKVMQSVHSDVRVRGYVISSLGAQINRASALVFRMRHVYERVMPIGK